MTDSQENLPGLSTRLNGKDWVRGWWAALDPAPAPPYDKDTYIALALPTFQRALAFDLVAVDTEALLRQRLGKLITELFKELGINKTSDGTWQPRLELDWDEFLALEIGKATLARQDLDKIQTEVAEYLGANPQQGLTVRKVMREIRREAGITGS